MDISLIIKYLMLFFGSVIFGYMLLVIVSYTIMLMFSLFQLRKQYRLNKYDFDNELTNIMYTKPVSIIVPAYNEEAGIVESVRSLLSLRYPQMEIIVVNDGSNDETLKKLINHFQMKKIQKVIREQLKTERVIAVYQSKLQPNLILVDKENGGKADALNAGLNLSKYPFFCSIDGDSILEPNSLLKVMRPIVTSNEEVIASGGNVRIANGSDIKLGNILKVSLSKNPLVVMQVIEYLRAFLLGRIALSKHNLVLIISGAFSVFSKKWVIEAGGYSRNMIGEDMEIVVRLHRLVKERKENKKIVFVSDPVCWTEAPETFSFLRKQRRRWHQGLFSSLWKHRKMTFNPKYGAVGMISFPYFWIVECLGPIIELGGYLYIIYAFFTGGIYLEFAMLLTSLFIFYGLLFSVVSVLLEAWSINSYPKVSDIIRLYIYSFSELFWYRPLTVIWRCEGIWQFLRQKKDWGYMERKGLARKGIEG